MIVFRNIWVCFSPLFLSYVLVASCGSDSSSKKQATIDGTWESSCVNEDSVFKRKSVSFGQGGSYSFSEISFDDPACQTNQLTSFTSEGTYKTVSDRTSDGFIDVDLTPAELSLSVISASLATTYISNGYCGYFDWQANTVKDVAGKICTIAGSGFRFAEKELVTNQVVQLVDNNLFLGRDFLKKNSVRPEATASVSFGNTDRLLLTDGILLEEAE